ncbi:hypothetical protein HMPREF9098_2476 [Kingella denitrificans ATCC 33394]|uniref:Uncharacterized protein n=1 Tax=Kingella denitrificans ATCC 33394 TaxID=888741 RepID=F0F2Z1_9NEIS|nr:hypothetical protein HMPREF9098_2476 [Kingella denitrificans ATCC 33394]
MFARHDLVPFLLIINLLINFNAVLHAPTLCAGRNITHFE